MPPDPSPVKPARTRIRRLQKTARVLFVAYLALLALVVLSPSSGIADALLAASAARLDASGLPPTLIDLRRLEVLANVAIVVPVGLMGALSFSRLRWQDWAAYGFVFAVSAELTQGLLLSGREMSGTDVVANTGGAMAGAVAVDVFCRRRRSPER